MTHLTDTTLNGYIHHTLTDAERESIDVHLAECTSCRSRTQEAERLQRHIHQSLTAEIRAVQPSAKMTFTAVTPALHRRRWAGFQFNALQVLSTIGTMAVIAVIATLAFYIIQQRNEQPFGSSPLGQMRDSRVFFGQEWTDPTPYQSGLIRSEQAALDLLATAPIYHMDLTLSDDLRRVNGRQDLRFTNNSSSGLTDLYFHLLPNLVNHSLTIRGVNINGEAVNWELVENGRYLRIYLPYTTAPGEQFVVSMDFVLQLVGSNRGFNGTLGNIEDVLTLAHFHPMLVAMQNGQWDLTPTVHGLGNLTDNSFYQVRVNAPEPLTILSNGLEIRRALITEENITRQNITLAAGPVNQFFLTASNQFNTVISKTVGETTINSYAEADYLRRDAQTALTITASALSVYNAEFGTYPFTELDIIDLPMSGLTEATMTHPGVVLLNLSYYQLEPEALERAIIHNIARQWFGQATGSNSLKDPWLVDGLSAYSSRIYATAVNNPQQRAALETIWDKLWQDISFKLPIGMPVQNYTSEHFYKTMRGHTPLVLSQLADEIGEEQVTAVLRAYTQTHRWQPGDTDAFKKLAETTCTCDLTEFFMQEVYLPRRE